MPFNGTVVLLIKGFIKFESVHVKTICAVMNKGKFAQSRLSNKPCSNLLLLRSYSIALLTPVLTLLSNGPSALL